MRTVGLLVALVGCSTGEWVREYRGFVPGIGRSEAAVFLVRDKWTGQPIEGALVRQHREWRLDRNGRWAPLVAEGRTDEYGLVAFQVPDDAGSCHWTIDAPGYAPTEEYGRRIQPDVDMEPGREQAGRLLGPQGQPLANVEVEYKTGCAHAPALRTTRTDSDGVFVFENVGSGDITFEGPGFEADYWRGDVRERPRRWGIDSYQVLPGGCLRGRLSCADGSAPRWAAVHSNTSPRGPRAVADEAGRFVLRGVRLTANLFVHLEDAVPTVETSDYRPGGPIVVRLGATSEEGNGTESVYVSLVDGAGERPDKLCTVFLDRVVDGWRFPVEWSPWQDGPSELCVPPGEYLLSVGEPWSPYVAEPRAVSVTGPLRTTVRVHRQPTLDVDLPRLDGDPIRKTRILLTDRHWEVDLEDPEDPAYLPAKGKAWLRVDLGPVPHTFPIGAVQEGRRTVEVKLPGLKRILCPGLRGRCHVGLMYLEAAQVDLPGMEDSDEDRSLATYAFGRHWLAVWHERLGRSFFAIDLPWSATDPIELRGLVFEPHPDAAVLRVLGPDGSPVPGAYVEVRDDGSPPGYSWSRPDEGQTDEKGVYRDPALRDGTDVCVVLDGFLRRWKRLQGEAPYVVRLGSGTIELDLRDHPEARVVFDGQAWLRPDEDGTLVLRGIRSGRHDLLVGADGHVALVYRVVLRDGEVRRMRPELRVRSGR